MTRWTMEHKSQQLLNMATIRAMKHVDSGTDMAATNVADKEGMSKGCGNGGMNIGGDNGNNIILNVGGRSNAEYEEENISMLVGDPKRKRADHNVGPSIEVAAQLEEEKTSMGGDPKNEISVGFASQARRMP